MQFGKFHGLILVAFGFLLFAVQAWMFFEYSLPPGENSAKRQAISQSEDKPVQEKHVSYLPLILGGFAVTVGGMLLLVHHEKRIEKAAGELDAHGRA
jgi:ABC-type phosphate transport system permease subunit